jgi:hypothetical protein
LETNQNPEMLEYFHSPNNHDASEDCVAAEVIKNVSLLLATRSCPEICRLSELKDAEERECEKEKRSERVMKVSDDVLGMGRDWRRIRCGGEPRDTKSKNAGKTTGNSVREIVALRSEVEYADGAKQAYEYATHAGVVIGAD